MLRKSKKISNTCIVTIHCANMYQNANGGIAINNIYPINFKTEYLSEFIVNSPNKRLYRQRTTPQLQCLTTYRH